MRIGIIGFGREGRSVFSFLKKSPRYRGAKIEVLDKKFDKNYLKNLERFDVLFRSPGVPWNLPALKRARARGVVFSSATRLFFSASQRTGATIIGVTGTKGKGTTSTLIYKILSAKGGSASGGKAGRNVFLAGNIGTSPLEILSKLTRRSIVVLELSSFQLQDLAESPRIAVILDVFPDHQDAHKNLKEYYAAKTNVARHQKSGDRIFFFARSPLSAWAARKGRGRKIAVDEKKFSLFLPGALKIKGAHNFKNAAMAATVCASIGVPAKTIIRVVRNFHGIPHRLEFVKTIQHIVFYNDSASTNPHTSAAALLAFPGIKKILIAGGQDKGLDYSPLLKALRTCGKEVAVVLLGENRNKIRKTIARSGVPIYNASNLRNAVLIAYKKAKRFGNEDRVAVILSPGAASFDMFQDYADRGARFKNIVHAL